MKKVEINKENNEKCGFELNHQGKSVFPPQEPIPCCFSEVNTLGKHITNCTNLPTKLDKDNVQVRYFCEEHMIKVENIRRKMAQKYINEYKEKLIEYCKRCDYQFSNSWYTQKYDDNICTDCFAEEGEWNEELEGNDDEDDE